MISKRASIKAIAYAEKVSSTALAKNANWETVFDTVMDGYEYSVQSQCARTGDNTIIKLYKDDEVLETFTIPNSEVFDVVTYEWDWSYIFKTIVEWMMSKRRKPKKIKMSQKQIALRIDELRKIIKESKGTEKRKAIKEYNTLSKLVVEEHKPESTPTKPSIDELRKQRSKLCMKISYNKKLGRDVSELEVQLEELRKNIKNYK